MARAPVGMPQNRVGAAPSEDTLSGRGRAPTRSECTLAAAAPTNRVPQERAETHTTIYSSIFAKSLSVSNAEA